MDVVGHDNYEMNELIQKGTCKIHLILVCAYYGSFPEGSGL